MTFDLDIMYKGNLVIKMKIVNHWTYCVVRSRADFDHHHLSRYHL